MRNATSIKDLAEKHLKEFLLLAIGLKLRTLASKMEC